MADKTDLGEYIFKISPDIEELKRKLQQAEQEVRASVNRMNSSAKLGQGGSTQLANSSIASGAVGGAMGGAIAGGIVSSMFGPSGGGIGIGSSHPLTRSLGMSDIASLVANSNVPAAITGPSNTLGLPSGQLNVLAVGDEIRNPYGSMISPIGLNTMGNIKPVSNTVIDREGIAAAAASIPHGGRTRSGFLRLPALARIQGSVGIDPGPMKLATSGIGKIAGGFVAGMIHGQADIEGRMAANGYTDSGVTFKGALGGLASLLGGHDKKTGQTTFAGVHSDNNSRIEDLQQQYENVLGPGSRAVGAFAENWLGTDLGLGVGMDANATKQEQINKRMEAANRVIGSIYEAKTGYAEQLNYSTANIPGGMQYDPMARPLRDSLAVLKASKHELHNIRQKI